MFVDAVDEIRGLDESGLAARLVELEAERRRVEAMLAAVVQASALRGAYRADGHASVRGWVKALTNCSDAEATRLVRLGRLLDEIPQAGEALSAGGIGAGQATELARARCNPRCGEQLGEIAPTLLGHAARLPFADFRMCVRRWVMLADPDGAFRERDSAVGARMASVHASEEGVHMRADGGTALVAAEMTEIFERFCDAEFLTDVESADGPGLQLARTDAQRRFDALVAVFRAAACAPLDARVPEPTVNVVVDLATFERALAGVADTSAAGRGTDDPWSRRCETDEGVPVHPDDVVAAALVGRVRRVVVDGAGTVVDLGRRRRLFSGAARDAVLLQSCRCVWPGCGIPAGRSEADHLLPWSAGGATMPSNGAPMCARHNRAKNRGFVTRRGSDGRWRVHRPDGTELDEPPTDRPIAA